MRCPNCGCETQTKAKYCPYCGFIFSSLVSGPTGGAVSTDSIPRPRKRARRAKRSFLDYRDVVVLLLFLILLLEIIQLLVMIG